jgi:serine/threonine protein phosphatase PrpC
MSIGPQSAFPPPSATVKVTFGARSRRGQHRSVNEDHFAVIQLGRHQETLLTSLPFSDIPQRFDEFGHAMLVADGTGEDGSGETASRLAIETLSQLMLHFGRWNLRVNEQIAREMMDRAERFIEHVNTVMAASKRAADGIKQESTLTAIFGAGRDLFFAHVGHSRAYLLRDHLLMRLTRDHTHAAAADLSMAPLIDVKVASRDLAHILTGMLGARSALAIDLERFRILDHDRILVCTNGLTDVVEPQVIGALLGTEQTPDEQCAALLDAAKGSPDDATVVVAHYRVPR